MAVLVLTPAAVADVQLFSGASDASAAVALPEARIIVADDENNLLRCYSLAEGGPPTALFDLTESLVVDPRHPEVDIEGAALVGDRIYWISSHGRNKDGKTRSSRHRFFATRVQQQDAQTTLVPTGRVCTTLLRDLLDMKDAGPLGLDKAVGGAGSRRERLAPKQEGLNIEGLCATPDGKTLYIGFRNPRPRRHALVVPLTNPAAVIESGEKPRFGQPLLWDLRNLGIRDMTYSAHHQAYFVVAGPHDGGTGFALYRWSGKPFDTPKLIRSLDDIGSDFNPESVVAFANNSQLFLLSDDGTRLVSVTGPHECLPGEWLTGNKCQNKHLLDAEGRTFRGSWVTVE